MDIQLFVFVLILSLFMIFVLNWIYFFDWMGLIGKLVSIIAPQKRVKEIEENQKLRKNDIFKNHIKKWKMNFLLSPAIFSFVFSITTVLIKSLLVAYFCCLVLIPIIYVILNKKEAKERKIIIKALQNERDIKE